MAKIYNSLTREYGGSGDSVTMEQLKEILKDYQQKIILGDGLGWVDETTNTIQVTNKVNALDGAVTLNPDDFVAESGTIKVKK